MNDCSILGSSTNSTVQFEPVIRIALYKCCCWRSYPKRQLYRLQLQCWLTLSAMASKLTPLPNLSVERPAQRLRRWVPSALRAPAAAYLQR